MKGKDYLHVAVGVIRDGQGNILISLRHDTAHQGGLWEFPGGKVESGESVERALARELKEELGWCPQKFEYLIKIMNKTVNCNITHYLAKCNISRDKLCLGEGAALGWFTYDEVLKLENKPNEVEYVTKLAKNRIKNS